MTSERSAARRELFELAGDAGLIAAAVLAGLTALVLLIARAAGDGDLPVVLQAASAAAVLLGVTAGPAAAWIMHRRPVTLPAALGALLGVPLAGAVFGLVVALSTALGWALSPLTQAEYAGPLAAGALVAADFVGLIVWLVIDAFRDARGRRQHHSLNVARAVSAAVVGTFSATIIVLSLGPMGGEILEAFAFVLMGAVVGASAATLAHVAVSLAARGSSTPEDGAA